MTQSVEVRLRLRDFGYHKDGKLYVDPELDKWRTVIFMLDGECNHEETLCAECADSWANDYELHPEDKARLQAYLEGGE